MIDYLMYSKLPLDNYTHLTLLGYQMLRCKLRCTKANGRITDNSHYHCCLCGRVLVRKVHLYCHLQAHSVGSMREIDEMLDAKDEAEEGPLDDSQMDDDDDNDTTLDTSQIATLDGSDQDNVVALSDGTQVTFHSCNSNTISKAKKNLNSSLDLDKQLSNFACLGQV